MFCPVCPVFSLCLVDPVWQCDYLVGEEETGSKVILVVLFRAQHT